MTVMTQVDARIADQRLLDHPFYQSWSSGDLPREALERYAEQYYHWVKAFPTYLSLTHAQSDDLSVRQEILENLNDEEMGPDNHIDLWLRFCDALGLDRDEVEAVELLPETRQAIEAMRETCSRKPFVGGMAALYAYESQQPEVMKTKREGLTQLYEVHEGHDYFVEHETADIRHSAQERALVEAHSEGNEAEILAGTQVALDAIYALLDGIHQRYVVPAAA